MANDLGRVGSANVAITADLSKLSSQLEAAVRESEIAGQKIGQGIGQGVEQSTQYWQSADGKWQDAFGRFVTEAEATGEAAGSGLGNKLGEGIKNAAGSASQAFTATLKNISGFLDEFGSKLSSVGTALSIGITAPLVLLGKAAIDSFGEMDSLNRALVAVTGSAQAASAEFADLIEVAKLPGLSMEAAVQGAVNLQAFGFSAAQSKDILLAFGNALASVGKGQAELDRVILQLGQMAGAGRVLMQDLRPIIQTVPQVATIIKQNFGSAALSDPGAAMDKLGMSSQQFIQVLVDGLKQLPQVTGGIKNSIENFSDSMTQALSKLGKSLEPFASGFLDKAASAVTALIDRFTALPGAVQTTSIVMAGFFAALGPALFVMGGLASAISNTIELVGLMRTAFAALQASSIAAQFTEITTAVSGLAAGMSLLEIAMLALPWVAVAAGGALLAKAFFDVSGATYQATDAVKNFGVQVDSAMAKVLTHGGNKGAGDWASTMRDFAAATDEAANSLPKLSKASQDLISKQDELRAKVASLKQSINELSTAQKNGVDVTLALGLAKKDLAAAEAALTPRTKEQTAEAKKQAEIFKDMKEAAQGLTGKLKELFAQQTAGVSEWGQVSAGATKAINEIIDAEVKLGQETLRVDQASKTGLAGLPLLANAIEKTWTAAKSSTQVAIDGMIKGWQDQQAEIDKTTAIYNKYGIVSADALKATETELKKNYEASQAQGKSLYEQLQWHQQLLEVQIRELAVSTDISLSEDDRRTKMQALQAELQGVNNQIDNLNQRQKEGINWTQEWNKVWSQTFNTLAQGLTSAITGAQSWGQAMTNIFRQVRDQLINLVVRAFLIDLGNALTGVSGQVSQLKNLFDSLFTSIKATIGTKGGGATAASGIAGGAADVVGIIGLAVQVISDIVQGLQLARIEGSLNAIEEGTRTSSLYLGGRADGGILGVLFKILEEISWGVNTKATEQIRDILASGITIAGGGGTPVPFPGSQAGTSSEAQDQANSIDAAQVAQQQANRQQTQSSQDLQAQTVSTSRELDALTSTMGDVQDATASLSTNFDVNTASIDELNKRYDDLKASGQGMSNEAVAIQQKLASLRQQMSDMSTATGNTTNAVTQATGAVQNLGTAAAGIGSGVSKATAAITGSITDMVSDVATAVKAAVQQTRAVITGTLDQPGNVPAAQQASGATASKQAASLTPYTAPYIVAPTGPTFADLAARANQTSYTNPVAGLTVNINGGTFSSQKFIDEVGAGLVAQVRLAGANL